MSQPTNRYGVDVEYFRREMSKLAASLDDRPAAELSRYFQVLANIAADIHNGKAPPSLQAVPPPLVRPMKLRAEVEGDSESERTTQIIIERLTGKYDILTTYPTQHGEFAKEIAYRINHFEGPHPEGSNTPKGAE